MKLKWSPDDKFIMCINSRTHIVYLRSLTEEVIEANLEGWTGTIQEDLLATATWSSDSRTVLIFSEMKLCATAWSITEQIPIARFESPKLLPPKGIDFSQNGMFMALLQKIGPESRTAVSIYYAGADWKLTNQFEVPDIYDAQDCKWAMNNTAIMVQDSPLESKFVIYAVMTGQKIVQHTPEANLGLGIRTLSQSPNAKMLACGIYDSNLMLYNNCTQVQICELQHNSSLQIDPKQDQASQPDIFKEELIRQEGRVQFAGGDTSNLGYHYVNVVTQSLLETSQVDAQQKITIKIPQMPKKDQAAFLHSTFDQVGLKGPPTGIQSIEWSFDSQYMATKCETMPNSVWVWDTTTLSLAAVLMHIHSVKTLKFAPHSQQLYIGTGQSRVFMWSPNGACVIDLPRNEFAAQGPNQVNVHHILWNPKGTNMVFTDRAVAILGFPSADIAPRGGRDRQTFK